ncbi:hypothetical protein U1839_25220 [Sphingomonas sp. RT2P30]|uniref:hypothetical protein n=1 Tax=Parasphingomonas halimpatiens TaxID=3096162 RepID=UPI002FC71B27
MSTRPRLKVELLNYLVDYEIPAIVVRYDASSDVLRWAWISAIRTCAQLSPSQKTFTHHFAATSIWNDDTPATIERALRERRALANFPASSTMPIRLTVDDTASGAAYAAERAVRRIVVGSAGTLVAAGRNQAPVELNIRVREGFLSVGFDQLTSMTFDIDTADSAKMVAAILYAMAFLFARKRLATHARAAGRAILAGNHVAGHPDLTARASYAFADDGMAQAELAILNNLHIGDTLYYPVVLANLVKAGQRDGGTEPAERFLNAALEATDGDPSQAAAIHYSTANTLRARRPSRALFHYNRARHLRPSYLKVDYFLNELAGTLFRIKRYGCAVEAYSRVVLIAPSHRLQLCLGDALLYSGDVEAALGWFELASKSDVAPLMEEAVVKLELSRMLVASHGPNIPTDWSRPMGDLPAGSDGRTAWIEHLATINALDPLAHFNLGVIDAKIGDDASALGHFVACAIVQPGDIEAWTNAIISAFRDKQAALALTLIHLSIRLAGLDAYDALRANLLAQGGKPSLIAELDKAAFAADARQYPTIVRGVTLRVLDGDRAEVVGQSDI